jgi:hypothetical protein
MAACCLLVLLLASPLTGRAFDWKLGKGLNLNLRGDITYALKLRTEYPTPRFVTPGSPYFVSGDANFDKWDLGNNALIGTVEVLLDADRVTFFGRLQGFVDVVYLEEDTHNAEVREHAAYNITDSLEFYLEGRTGALTGRAGRQIIQWGQSSAPIYAPGVNVVSPFFVQRVSSAGYTFRSWQVPTFMAWGSYEASERVSIEAVWQPDFDPRFYVPVAGTFQSPTDLLGFGVDTELVDDRRPRDWVDQQQYGGAVRTLIAPLGMLEVGIYYYHYRLRMPVLSMPEVYPVEILIEYPELDLFGISFSQAIQTLGLHLQVGGELAYRPNEPLQKDARNSPFLAQVSGRATALGGWERANTLSWNVNAMRFFFDILEFTPWTFNLTPLVECYGRINLDYAEEASFSDPRFTAYYNIQLPLTTSDMIDNTRLELSFQSMGGMHSAKNLLHTMSFTAGAKYGDSWEVLFGYNLGVGNLEQDPLGIWMWDRDNFVMKLTYYFI